MLSDADYMARALFHAERGRGRTAPNPVVGAVVVSADGVVVGTGYHEAAGQPHAEARALDAASARARGATLFCTLEPCCHTGRTGPCTARIVEAGICRVVSAIQDPNPRVAGGGFRYLRERGVDVVDGIMREEAARANAPFFTWVREGRPLVTMKVALSADGRVAARAGVRTAITGPVAARWVHRDRACTDAIGVGVGTVLIDDPLLTARGAWRHRPLTRVVFDRTLRTPPAARLFSTLDAGPVIILTTAESAALPQVAPLLRAGARIEPIAGDFLPGALRALGRLEITALTLEGGPTLHDAVWRADLVDRVQIYIARTTLGSEGVRWLAGDMPPWSALASARTRRLGDDVLIEADVHRAD
jgi:diaminohydroxyphosphoribosylaminopyrimidine deaminase/5-amino-6-(5-phosphoribosylamino)uracil reductase